MKLSAFLIVIIFFFGLAVLCAAVPVLVVWLLVGCVKFIVGGFYDLVQPIFYRSRKADKKERPAKEKSKLNIFSILNFLDNGKKKESEKTSQAFA